MSSQLIQFHEPEPANWDLDVIFVHGLDGDLEKTWASGNGNESWTRWLGEDYPNVGVWSFGYEAWSSKWRGPAMPLQDRATNALAYLRAHGLGHRPICFVCHSLGGLVVKQLIFQAQVLSPEYLPEVGAIKGVYFLSTPHTGSGLANLGEFFRVPLRRTVAISDLRDNDPYLRQLNAWYRANALEYGIDHLVFFENEKTRGMLVVDEVSSDPGLQGVTPIRVDANHTTICKPQSRSDLTYRLISQSIARITDKSRSSPVEVNETVRRLAPAIDLDPTPLVPGDTPMSVEFIEPAWLEFDNRSDFVFEIIWHDFDGAEVKWGILKPLELMRVQTFVTHPWTLQSTEAGSFGPFMPISNAIGRVQLVPPFNT